MKIKILEEGGDYMIIGNFKKNLEINVFTEEKIGMSDVKGLKKKITE